MLSLSRSKLELFLSCHRCFYFDYLHKIKRPKFPPFNLNNAVDQLMKKEFDHYRHSHSQHPIMKEFGVDAVPYSHDDLEIWREPLRGGLRFLETNSNIELRGAPDDIWINETGELIIVDYKATINMHEAYKRQLEVYSWLLRKKGFKVSATGYILFAMCNTFADSFSKKLEFKMKLEPVQLEDSWIEPELQKIRKLIDGEEMPKAGDSCDFCAYNQKIKKLDEPHVTQNTLFS